MNDMLIQYSVCKCNCNGKLNFRITSIGTTEQVHRPANVHWRQRLEVKSQVFARSECIPDEFDGFIL